MGHINHISDKSPSGSDFGVISPYNRSLTSPERAGCHSVCPYFSENIIKGEISAVALGSSR